MLKFKIKLLIPILFYLCSLSFTSAQQAVRLDKSWSFVRSDLGGIWESVRTYSPGSPEAVPIWDTVDLPHSYNAFDAVDPDKNYYQGPAWYRKWITIENPYADGRTLLHFEGVGQKAEVYVYTTKVGDHVGGYDEWYVDITEAVATFKNTKEFKEKYKGKIPVSIRVDNSRDLEMIPSDLSDFNLYGGIYRHINLKYLPEISLEKTLATIQVDRKGKEGKVSVKAHLQGGQQAKDVNIDVQLINPLGKVISSFSKKTISAHTKELELGTLTVKKPALWSPEDPVLYRLVVTADFGEGQYKEEHKIGFRHVEFQEQGPFFLNGKRLLLRGTHRHEDHAGVGPAMTDDMIRNEMSMMKEMGVNFIRLGHYQQSRVVLEACDSLGILVWEEIPWCRGGLGGEVYKQQARRMLTNLIEQHYNHTSIILWGLGNENDWPGDFSYFDRQEIRNFMKELHDLSHQLDPHRLTAIRRCDFCKDIVDVYSPSIWAGWYRGLYTDYKNSSADEHKKVKHFLHVEWGGDSHAGRHSESPDNALAKIESEGETDERAGDASMYGGAARVSKDGDWSESYICNLIDWHLKEQETMPWLTGTAYWPFKDFSTPVRPENPVPYVNQKGVVERDFKKKESYYVFQSYWTKNLMAHIYGHSWPVRWGEADEKKMVKVYSNADEVELFFNGESLGVKKRNSQDFPAAGLRWMVTFKEGKNHIEAVAKKRQRNRQR
jgi:beta-galactosidase